MGILLKVVLFGLVFYYIFKTIGSFVFRILGGPTQQPPKQQSAQQRKSGEINVEYMPKGKKQKPGPGSKDGDYIDFEELK